MVRWCFFVCCVQSVHVWYEGSVGVACGAVFLCGVCVLARAGVLVCVFCRSAMKKSITFKNTLVGVAGLAHRVRR